MLLLIKTLFNMTVFALSSAGLGIVVGFVGNSETLKLSSAPKALVNLQEIFLPPLINLQSFVFAFDLIVALYYMYQLPCLDRIKQRFVYYQYESQPVEKQDCSNLFLSTLFIILSKVRHHSW